MRISGTESSSVTLSQTVWLIIFKNYDTKLNFREYTKVFPILYFIYYDKIVLKV